MNIEELDALMAEVDAKFNPLKVEEGRLQARLAEIDTELKRFQGEYKAYDRLKKSLLERTPQEAAIANDPAGLTPDPFKKKAAKEPETVNAS